MNTYYKDILKLIKPKFPNATINDIIKAEQALRNPGYDRNNKIAIELRKIMADYHNSNYNEFLKFMKVKENKTIKKFTHLLNETFGDFKIYFDLSNKELWISSNVGSGQAIQYRNLKKYFTNKKSDSNKFANYNSLVNDIVNWSKNNKPYKTGKKGNIYKIPAYNVNKYLIYKNSRENIEKHLSIWNGKIQPDNYYYLVISIEQGSEEKYQIINLFDNLREALYWIKN